jgi:hypothetical protein
MPIKKMSEADVKAEAIAFASKAGLSGKWPQEAHIALLAFLIAKTLGIADAESKIAMMDLFAQHGLGGNASQFSQWVWPKKAASPEASGNRYAGFLTPEAPKPPEPPKA